MGIDQSNGEGWTRALKKSGPGQWGWGKVAWKTKSGSIRMTGPDT